MAVLMVLLGSVVTLCFVLVDGDRRTDGGVRRALRTAGVVMQPVGTGIVDLVGTSPDGSRRSVALSGRSTLLVFLSSTCLTCDALWRGADRAARRAPPGLQIVVVTRGHASESERLVASKAPSSVLVVMSDEAWDTYGVGAAPALVVVDGATDRTRSLEGVTTWSEAFVATRIAR